MGYYIILNAYNWFGTALYANLTDTKMISPKLAPLAFGVITQDKNETNSWTLLYQPLCSRNPLLGDKGNDVISEIINLRINSNDNIHTFYERVVNIQEKLDFRTKTIS